ncbi:hypothetical protein [Pontibacter kalidii]|uniref:hypothetical protein n=1 Tax=Pontibacter kalidii TaxID=2592049 RepID=UPI00225280FC|nr:hypothetical protein [Pontibacter kalidii]
MASPEEVNYPQAIIIPLPPSKGDLVQALLAVAIESVPSLWVERLVDFRFRFSEIAETAGQAKEMYTARCPKTSPLGLESTKAEVKRAGCKAKDERQLVRMTCMKMQQAVAMKV